MMDLNVVDFIKMAEHDGLEAFVAGEAVTANPFTPGCDLAVAWQAGWQGAARAVWADISSSNPPVLRFKSDGISVP